MDRYLVVQRIGDILLSVAVSAGVVIILKEGDRARLWIAVGGIVIGGVFSWTGRAWRKR